jgi:hypothetical protein
VSRIYLVTFNGPAEMRDLLTGFLDSRDEIVDWHSSMVNTVFVKTDLDVVAMRELLRRGPAKRFIVIEVDPEDFNQAISGWLPRSTWDFIKQRQPAK